MSSTFFLGLALRSISPFTMPAKVGPSGTDSASSSGFFGA